MVKPFLTYYNFNILACQRLYKQVKESSDESKFKDSFDKIYTEIKTSGLNDELVIDLMTAATTYFRFPNMISNMILVSMTSYFEQYLNSCLSIFLLNNNNTLRKKSKTITFEEIISQGEYHKLIDYMIKKEMNDLFRQNIDDIYKDLKDDLHILLDGIQGMKFPSSKKSETELLKSQPDDDDDEEIEVSWEDLREIFYRRNIIVHNDGKIDKDYIKKVQKGNENDYVITDDHYIKKSILVFMKYGEFIHQEIIKKMV